MMNRRLLMVAWALPLLMAGAEPVAATFPRTPPYFVVRYHLPDSKLESEKWAFLHPGTDGFTEIRGPFSVRRYHDRDTNVEAVFFRPELVLAAVTFRRPAGWMQADVDALLAEYGARWRILAPGMWVSHEGVRAIHRDGTFHLVSGRILGEMDAVRFPPPEKR
ncbi:MAG TPA: hypothetical protein VG734_12840 [Lacunisphaera sp.]|nr:hypothetical protein [Lacunisphaera sp.]